MEKKKNEKNRTFKQFLKHENTSIIKQIAAEYATDNDFNSYDKIAEKYGTSSTIIRKLVKYAIINNLVTYQTALLIKKKAHRNQGGHYKKERKTTSDTYYERILEERIKFIKYNIPDEDAIFIASNYIVYPAKSIDELGQMLGYSKHELNVILHRASYFRLITDETYEQLKSIALSKPRSESVITFFKKLDENRNTLFTLDSKIEHLEDEISKSDADAADIKQKKEYLTKLLELRNNYSLAF